MDMDRVDYEAEFRLDLRKCHGIRKGGCDGLSSIFGQAFLRGSDCKYPATATITAGIRGVHF